MRKFLYFLIFSLLSILTYSETRDIYIGDTIKLKVESLMIDEDELREKFKDFEIDKIEREEEFYVLSLKTYDVGDHLIKIGNNNIKIRVKSLRDVYKKDEIFKIESDEARNLEIMEEKTYFYKALFLLIFLIILIVILVYYILKFLLKAKKVIIDERSKLEEKLKESIDIDEIIFIFKKYISIKDNILSVSFSSEEFISYLKERDNGLSDEFVEILKVLDEKRYSNIEIKTEELEKLRTSIKKIIETWNEKEAENV